MKTMETQTIIIGFLDQDLSNYKPLTSKVYNNYKVTHKPVMLLWTGEENTLSLLLNETGVMSSLELEQNIHLLHIDNTHRLFKCS